MSVKQPKFSRFDLKTMQSWDLEHKIAVSKTRIIEFYNAMYNKINNSCGVYISFSGGKDSTVLLHLVRSIFPDVQAVWYDTGLEYPEIREFVKTFDNVKILHPVKWDKHTRKYVRTNFRKVIKEDGYPVVSKDISKVIEEVRRNESIGKNTYRTQRLNGMALDKNGNQSRYNCPQWKFLLDAPFKISDKCCDRMKKAPSKAYSKETGLYPIIGTMASESQLRKHQWLRQGCNIIDSKNPQSKPISFWTEQDVFAYIKKYDLEIASVYGDILQDKNGKYYTTGCNRTGCVWCPFGAHLEKEPTRYQRLKETHPDLWNYCMKPYEEGGIGLKKVLDFINVKYE